METARITFSVPKQVSDLAAERAAGEKRSLSSYIAILIEKDLRDAGVLTASGEIADHGALLEKVSVRLRSDPPFEKRLGRLLNSSSRARRAKEIAAV